MSLLRLGLPAVVAALAVGACQGGGGQPAPEKGGETLPRALALGLALFEKSPEGKQVPQPATAAFLVLKNGTWEYHTFVDDGLQRLPQGDGVQPRPG